MALQDLNMMPSISFGLPFEPEDSQYGEYRLTGLAGPDYDATISFGLSFEPEDSQYGESRRKRSPVNLYQFREKRSESI